MPRTVRALGHHDLRAAQTTGIALARDLPAGPVWLVRAGGVPLARPVFPPPSQTARPVCAVGALFAPNRREVQAMTQEWAALLQQTGGELEHAHTPLPEIASLFLAAELVETFRQLLIQNPSAPLHMLVEQLLKRQPSRLIRFRPLDVALDTRLRVPQVITSLQRGGAERLVMDLSRALDGIPGVRSIYSPIILTGKPSRAPFEPPAQTIDVSDAGNREARLAAAAQAARALHADALHLHLLAGTDLAAFRATEIPLAITLHNLRQGWPPGIESLAEGSAEMLVACSQRVEEDARAVFGAGPAVPIRTAWNGIEARSLEWTPALGQAAKDLRARWGAEDRDLVLLAIANPRPQKRLHLLPAVVAATHDLLMSRQEARKTFLIIAGETENLLPDAQAAVDLLDAEVRRLGLENEVVRLGSVEDMAPLLHAADVLVSASAWEGLSLAHLEAVAAGVPVVATDAGGTAEIAAVCKGVQVLPLEVGAEEFARAVLEAHALRARPAPQLPAHFRRERMAERYGQLFPRVIARRFFGRKQQGLWLIANNFSTGGAQSSARRLLAALHEQEIVRAAVVQEEISYPTSGRSALEALGVRVLAMPPPPPMGDTDPAVAVAQLLEEMDADPPEAVIFWNLLTQYKVLLADLLLDTPVFDVSPGEMYFSSLAAYFGNPRPGLPYLSARDYGRRLAGVIVKYSGEVELAREVLGLAEQQVHLIPNGVNVPAQMPPGRADADGVLHLGTSCRLSPQKKLEELFAALRVAGKRLPDYRLHIAGGPDGGNTEYAAVLRERSQDLPIEWQGEVSDMARFLGGLDLFVMISEPAGCPNASMEAMAAGLPVIATDFGGAGEQVVDWRTGRLVRRGDTEALADAIADACSDRDRLRRWGENGWRRARDLLGINHMAEHYRRVLLGR